MELPNHCQLCPRRCGANRRAGQTGACGADATLRIARAALHEWEEPPISVGAGSGAVFFSNCPLRCVYCQNAEIACGSHGTVVVPDRLERIFFELADQGAANINLVTPTHYLPFLTRAVDDAHMEGFHLPFICNTSGYETVDTVLLLTGRIDVYLTDFKYWRDGQSDAARRYSNAPDYFDVASAALRTMRETAGPPRFDRWLESPGQADGEGPGALRIPGDAPEALRVGIASDGVKARDGREASCMFQDRLVGGVVVRHLMLPGRLRDSQRILAYLWSEYGDDVLYSIMNQYTPMRSFPMCPELDSRVPDEDYERLLDFADRLGMTDYYWQEGGAAQESFVPAFDSTGV